MAEQTWAVWLVIGLSSLATYAYRLGGLSLARRLPRQGPLKRAMDALPGCILVALVAPAALQSGPWGVAGALLAAVITVITKNLFAAMAAGMLVVALSRYLGWG